MWQNNHKYIICSLIRRPSAQPHEKLGEVGEKQNGRGSGDLHWGHTDLCLECRDTNYYVIIKYYHI